MLSKQFPVRGHLRSDAYCRRISLSLSALILLYMWPYKLLIALLWEKQCRDGRVCLRLWFRDAVYQGREVTATGAEAAGHVTAPVSGPRGAASVAQPVLSFHSLLGQRPHLGWVFLPPLILILKRRQPRARARFVPCVILYLSSWQKLLILVACYWWKHWRHLIYRFPGTPLCRWYPFALLLSSPLIS